MSSDFDGWLPIPSTLEFRVCVSAARRNFRVFRSVLKEAQRVSLPCGLITTEITLAFPVLRLLRPAVRESQSTFWSIHPSIHQSHVSLQEYGAPCLFKYSFILPQYFAAAAVASVRAAAVRLITTGWSSPRQHSFRLFDPLLFGLFFFFNLLVVDVVRHH